MKKQITLCLLACCSMAASSWAQDVPVNREKYPDYVDPTKAYQPNARLVKYVQEYKANKSRMTNGAKADQLPDHWNNAETKHFPPVFNQQGGSCGSASRIGYMFTHEFNSLRDLDGSLPENQYPTHFVWLLTNGNSGKNEFVEKVGVPNSIVYGGRTYSQLFGYQEETNNDFGWMTGYDKWKQAIGNRMLAPTYVPWNVGTEEGRLAAKAWLVNHAGDTDFHSGGLIGLGVASGGQWYDIPKTDANDAAGVTGMKYVHRWGTQVDHAVTMVGYDDRIEFDLDGNGIAGEVDKDEKGAWIIVNSWGDWCNKGFIYCPYKYAGPVSNKETGAMTNGYWSGELYHARKDFRPMRALKLKIDYTHRSELLLQVGISSDLNATEPETFMDMHHFRYAGDGKNGNANPTPAMPMLGRWQGQLHHEPMELMYDLTDFSAALDQNKPLKYFFIINRKNETSEGTGNIYEASVVDMESDLEGVESNFDLGGEKFVIPNKGKRLMISAIVYGKGYYAVNNLQLSEGVLSWSKPTNGSYKVVSYNVYQDGKLLGNTKELSYAVSDGQVYAVTAVYEDGGESDKMTCSAAVAKNTVSSKIEDAGFIIPEVFNKHYKQCTIEFMFKPSRFVNWNNEAGPGWGTYMQHSNEDGTFVCGWNTGHRITSSVAFAKDKWQHVAIVVDDNKMTLYKDGKSVGTVSSNTYSGIGGFGNFVFSNSGSTKWHNAEYDEIRIWDHARSEQEIKGSRLLVKKQEFYGDVLPQGLLAYYKGDTFAGEDGNFYMRECVNGYHARVLGLESDPQVESTLKLTDSNLSASIKVDAPKEIFAGSPVTLTATRGDVINKVWWNVPACDIVDKHVVSPTVVFAKAGKYQVSVSGMAYNGKEYSDTLEVEVKDAIELDASFAVNSTSVPCGEHVSMHVNKYADGCSYEWFLPGANVEKVLGAKAGATYDKAGEHIVTLKVTSADGRVKEHKETIMVTAVAPDADFFVNEPVVLKGTPITLNCTSRFAPTSRQWIVDGPAQKTIVNDGVKMQTLTPQYPGRYDVSLNVSNAVGEDNITKKRALVVCNAESGSGLNFSQPGAQVTIPNSTDFAAFTIDFWANPSTLGENSWGIGKDKNTLLLSVSKDGSMKVCIRGFEYSSPAGFMEAGVWNHYSISRSTLGSKGTIIFMRNGEEFHTIRNATTNKAFAKDMSTITLGVDGMPITGSIDEFRIWTGNHSSKMEELCVEPLKNPESAQGLVVYYDFNQNSGNVIDRTGHGNDGVRTGFGPDGDAWGKSLGVFSLYFGDKLEDQIITGIEDVESMDPVAAGRNGVYTLSGQYVGRTIEGLPAGLYIVDGKKMAVK